jgi:hypothetical protein
VEEMQIAAIVGTSTITQRTQEKTSFIYGPGGGSLQYLESILAFCNTAPFQIVLSICKTLRFEYQAK